MASSFLFISHILADNGHPRQIFPPVLAWHFYRGLHLGKFEMDCIWVNLKSVGPLFSKLYQFISKCHLNSWKIILSCYVVVILQMKDSCPAYLTFRAHNSQKQRDLAPLK